MISLDFETRSEVDLKKVGTHVYAKHPSTRVLCAAYSIDAAPVRLWRPWLGEPMPADLQYALASDIIVAYNAAFERAILREVLKLDIDPSRFRCTQARARAQALPAKLELCARALEMPLQKQSQRVMQKWMKPLPNGQWADDPKEYAELCGYCARDVEVEQQLGGVLSPLTPDEQRDWEINEHINDTGIQVDVELCRAAQRYAVDEIDEIKQRLGVLTNGAITSPKQFARIKQWLGVTGTCDANARAAMLDEEDLSDVQREVIELIDDGGRASTAKFAAMATRAGADGRVRGSLVFAGAGQTLRYASQGIQLQNMINTPLDNVEDVIEQIIAGASRSALMEASGFNVLTTLSRCLRPAIIAREGHVLVWADYSAIEARVLPWLSDGVLAEPLLDAFASGADIYKRQATSMFNCSEEAVTKEQRQAAKTAVLACGFAGGANAYMRMAKKFNVPVTEAEAENYKQLWRRANPWAPRFWRALEKAAASAVRNPGQEFQAGRVVYHYAGGTLWCRLPSGNEIAYPFPEVKYVEGPYGVNDELTAMKASHQPKQGESEWPRMKLWASILAENVTQAYAAVLLRGALRALFDDGWGPAVIGHVHDEIILEVPEAEADEAEAELRAVMAIGPEGLPLACSVSRGFAYGK